MDTWLDERGVVVLKLFNNTSDNDALTREACMIDAIGMIINYYCNRIKGRGPDQTSGLTIKIIDLS